MGERPITPRKQYQEIKTIVSMSDIQLDPDRHPTLHVSNVFGRVFSYMVGRCGVQYRTLRTDQHGDLQTSPTFLYMNNRGLDELDMTTGGGDLVISPTTRCYGLYLTEGHLKYQFQHGDDPFTFPKFLPSGHMEFVQLPFPMNKIRLTSMGPPAGMCYMNRWRRFEE